MQVAAPVPVVGPGHTVQELPQLAGCDGSTQAPEQAMVGDAHWSPQLAPPSGSSVQVGVPVPAVGAGHTVNAEQLLPQWADELGSTHAPEQSSEVLPVQPTPHIPAVQVA